MQTIDWFLIGSAQWAYSETSITQCQCKHKLSKKGSFLQQQFCLCRVWFSWAAKRGRRSFSFCVLDGWGGDFASRLGERDWVEEEVRLLCKWTQAYIWWWNRLLFQLLDRLDDLKLWLILLSVRQKYPESIAERIHCARLFDQTTAQNHRCSTLFPVLEFWISFPWTPPSLPPSSVFWPMSNYSLTCLPFLGVLFRNRQELFHKFDVYQARLPLRGANYLLGLSDLGQRVSVEDNIWGERGCQLLDFCLINYPRLCS